MTLDPIAFGQQVARQTLAQDGRKRHLCSLPSHVTNVRPADKAAAAGHPCAAPFDYERDDDERPVLPPFVAAAVAELARGVMVPGSVPRPQHVEAAIAVTMWAQGGRVGTNDDAPAGGIPRPVLA
jgi:hypothetical protein